VILFKGHNVIKVIRTKRSTSLVALSTCLSILFNQSNITSLIRALQGHRNPFTHGYQVNESFRAHETRITLQSTAELQKSEEAKEVLLLLLYFCAFDTTEGRVGF